MTYNRRSQNGFGLVEVVVAASIFAISMATTVPMITRNHWKSDIDRYTNQLEAGLYSLRAKLGSRKTSCSINFPKTYQFLEANKITEFSQGVNRTSFNCCDSEISSLINDPDCEVGHPGYQLSDITRRQLDNLRLVQTESTPESEKVRIAVSTTDFGLTPPGTTAEAGTLIFLVCHQQALSKSNLNNCIDGQNRLRIGCVQIDGTGVIKKGLWMRQEGTPSISNGRCQAT